MKLSVLLALSLLKLSSEQKLQLALAGISLRDLQQYHVSLKRVHNMMHFLHENKEVQCTFYGMQSYPAMLYRMENPPFRLMYTKSLPKKDSQLLTVCGTRYPDAGGERRAYEFALCASAGGTHLIVSNSRGIDRIASHAATDFGMTCYVICDCGLGSKRIYDIAKQNNVSLVSAYEPYDVAIRSRCLNRNIISVGMGAATMVLQAPNPSGCLHCTTVALDQGKDVYVHSLGLDGGLRDDGIRYLSMMGAPDVNSYPQLASCLGWDDSAHLVQQPQDSALFRFGSTWYSLEYE